LFRCTTNPELIVLKVYYSLACISLHIPWEEPEYSSLRKVLQASYFEEQLLDSRKNNRSTKNLTRSTFLKQRSLANISLRIAWVFISGTYHHKL
jgi:hypothetical protein